LLVEPGWTGHKARLNKPEGALQQTRRRASTDEKARFNGTQ
jgi:hypothetical protein